MLTVYLAIEALKYQAIITTPEQPMKEGECFEKLLQSLQADDHQYNIWRGILYKYLGLTSYRLQGGRPLAGLTSIPETHHDDIRLPERHLWRCKENPSKVLKLLRIHVSSTKMPVMFLLGQLHNLVLVDLLDNAVKTIGDVVSFEQHMYDI